MTAYTTDKVNIKIFSRANKMKCVFIFLKISTFSSLCFLYSAAILREWQFDNILVLEIRY